MDVGDSECAGQLSLELRVLELPLRRPFRHALHERHTTRNLWVRAHWQGEDGHEAVGWGEGLPRDYVTGETEERALSTFRERGAEVAARGTGALGAGFAATPALRCALGLALVDAALRRHGEDAGAQRHLQRILQQHLPQGPPAAGRAVTARGVRYSGVLSADEPRRLAKTASLYRLGGFRAVKLKVGLGRDADVARTRLVRRILGRRVSLRLDANCAWQPDEAAETLTLLQPFGIDAVEEPLAPRSFAEAGELGRRLGLRIVLDESFTGVEDLHAAAAAGVPAIANLRLSKLGGLDRAWETARTARELGIGLQLGCQVGETGLLSAAGRAFALRCAGDLLFAEGSFDRHLLRDVPTRPDVTFAYGGLGRPLRGPGLGVVPVTELERWQVEPTLTAQALALAAPDRGTGVSGAPGQAACALAGHDPTRATPGDGAAPGVVEEVERVRGAGGRWLVVHRTIPATRPRAAAVLVHGIQSHAGWYRGTARALAAAGVEVASPERRGSGCDRRDRGDAPTAAALLADAHAVAAFLARASGHLPIWVGVSWGAKLAYLAAHATPQTAAGLALVVPGLIPRIRMSAAGQLRVATLAYLGGRFPVPIPLEDPALFSAEPHWQAWVASDPLALHEASARFMVASRVLDGRVARRRTRLPPSLPVLLVLADGDRIVDNRETLSFLRWQAGRRLQTLVCPRAAHTPELSEDAASYQARLVEFCLPEGLRGQVSQPRS